MLKVTSQVVIPTESIDLQFIRASGPGGQNVNKVSTAVQLRFDVRSAGLSAAVSARLLKIAGSQATKAHEIVLVAKRCRTQARNRDDAIKRLLAMIRQALVVPKPRKKTKISRAQKQRRLTNKHQRSKVKVSRKIPELD